MEHTPIPLTIETDPKSGNVAIQHAGIAFAIIYAGHVDDPVMVAREIVQAVNSHDELVAFIEGLFNCKDADEVHDYILDYASKILSKIKVTP